MPKYPPVPRHCPELYEPFDLYGYRLRPLRITTYLYPLDNPRELTVVSNSDGFRSSRELDELDERLRILILGDSFVFGEGVEENERFTNILETIQPHWRVDNLGMTGFGPDLMLRALETVGLDTKPDIVVFSIYTDDFHRVRPYYAGVGFKIPRFKLKSGQLVTTRYPKPHIWDRSVLYQTIRQVYWHKYVKFKLNAAILDRFLELAKVNRFMPVIIFLPGRGDTPTDKKRRTWLRHYAERNAVPFLDLSDVIHAKSNEKVFIRKNPHLNPQGHLLVATELHRFLTMQILHAP